MCTHARLTLYTILTCWLETLRVQCKLQTSSSSSFLAYSRLSTRGNYNNPGDLQLNDTRGTSKLTVGRRKVSLYIYTYTYPLSTHTRPLYLYFSRVHRPCIYIYTYNKYRSYTTAWCTFNTIRDIIYIYLYEIFSNCDFRRARLIRKSRFACSGKSKENMSAFPYFRFWFSFEIWPDRFPPPLYRPPSHRAAFVIVSSPLQHCPSVFFTP